MIKHLRHNCIKGTKAETDIPKGYILSNEKYAKENDLYWNFNTNKWTKVTKQDIKEKVAFFAIITKDKTLKKTKKLKKKTDEKVLASLHFPEKKEDVVDDKLKDTDVTYIIKIQDGNSSFYLKHNDSSLLVHIDNFGHCIFDNRYIVTAPRLFKSYDEVVRIVKMLRQIESTTRKYHSCPAIKFYVIEVVNHRITTTLKV